MPVSLPTSKPQPDAPVYGVAELDLFTCDTRASYLKRFGVQAPPFNPSRPVQRWFDSSADQLPKDDVYILQYFESLDDGTITRRRKGITNRDASTPNLPGEYQYPQARVLKPSGLWVAVTLLPSTDGGLAMVPDFSGERHYIPSEQLSEQAEAIAMRDQLRSAGFAMFDGLTEFYDNYSLDEGETRRSWCVISANGQIWSVGYLRTQTDKFGVGAPGHWQITDNGSPNWVCDVVPSSDNDPLPNLPVPQRTLLPNERLKLAFGGTIQVQRTDKSEVVELDDTKAMPARVRELLTIVKQIQADLKAA